jgi:hypothetical protein
MDSTPEAADGTDSEGMAPCCYCLWDIRRDASGRWRLAWNDDGDVDPYQCGGPGGHEPGRLENGRMVPLTRSPGA